MAEPFVGEIKMFAGNFAPRNWAFCDGQLLAISQNDALFSLLGTIYGGDGRTTFGLPDMRGRIPLHQGTGPGLSPRKIGDKTGTERETLTINQMPSHKHTFQASANPADAGYPAAAVVADTDTTAIYYNHDIAPVDPDTSFPDNTLSNTGGSQAHNNVMPFLCIHYIIALYGIYPSRS